MRVHDFLFKRLSLSGDLSHPRVLRWHSLRSHLRGWTTFASSKRRSGGFAGGIRASQIRASRIDQPEGPSRQGYLLGYIRLRRANEA